MAIATVEFDLSMSSPETGLYNTAKMYTVEGVTYPDGTPRELSIGQLVMALCLNRAAAMEAKVVELMNEIERASDLLANLTKIETAVIEEFQNDTSDHALDLSAMYLDSGSSYAELLREVGVLNSSQRKIRNDSATAAEVMLYDDFITQIEAKMDEKNSFSQQTMIELQSLTNKRDQSYDMISNILKSLNNVLVGIVNNT